MSSFARITSLSATQTENNDSEPPSSDPCCSIPTFLAALSLTNRLSATETNYDDAVDSSDLAKLLANYNQTLPSGISITATSYGHLDAQAIQMLAAAGFTVVPEPSTLVLLAAGLAALAGWMIRRRK